jgi:N-acetylglutamate synthase-like GNAT family acetyltransferase
VSKEFMVDMPGMLEHAIKIRRGRRTDEAALEVLLSPVPHTDSAKAQIRHWRRLASDPSLDFYVAEHNDGSIQGVVLVCYVRRLRVRGWEAVLDIVVHPAAASTIGQTLLDFAKARARKRGCQQLRLYTQHASRDQRYGFLTQAGFVPTGDVLSCGLG